MDLRQLEDTLRVVYLYTTYEAFLAQQRATTMKFQNNVLILSSISCQCDTHALSLEDVSKSSCIAELICSPFRLTEGTKKRKLNFCYPQVVSDSISSKMEQLPRRVILYISHLQRILTYSLCSRQLIDGLTSFNPKNMSVTP